MKKKLLLGVLAILTLSTLTMVALARNHTPITMYGNTQNYEYAYVNWPWDDPDDGWVESAQVLHGMWSLRIEKEKVYFEGIMYEKNLYPDFESAPVDSLDVLKQSMISNDYSFEDGILVFTGKVHVEKEGFALDDTIEKSSYVSFYKVTVDLNEDTIFFDSYPIDELELPWFGDWDRPGMVLGVYPPL